MLLQHPDIPGTNLELNENLLRQLTNMQIGFSFLGAWFLAFLFWWIFDKGIDPDKKG